MEGVSCHHGERVHLKEAGIMCMRPKRGVIISIWKLRLGDEVLRVMKRSRGQSLSSRSSHILAA